MVNFLPVAAGIGIQIGLSVMSTFAQLSFNCGMSPRIFVSLRLAIASIIIWPPALIFERNTRPPMTVKIFAQIVVMSFFEPLLVQQLYYAGLQLTTATFTTGMFNLFPAITFVVACLFRLEKIPIHSHQSRAKILGTCVAVAGAMVMTFWRGALIPLHWTFPPSAYKIDKIHETKDFVRGGVMLLSSCLSWSFYMIIQAKVVASYPAELSLTALLCTLGTIGSTIIALIWERNREVAWRMHPDMRLLALFYGGFFTAVTEYVVGWMVKKKGLVFVCIFNPVGLIITAAISTTVLSEQIFVGEIIGAFVILVGISFFLWGKMGEQSLLPTPPLTPPPTQPSTPPPTPPTDEQEAEVPDLEAPMAEETEEAEVLDLEAPMAEETEEEEQMYVSRITCGLLIILGILRLVVLLL